jgi:CMP-N-acetylneuraminic acid synthetase
MNGSVYVFRPDFLKNVNKMLFDGKMLVYHMFDSGALDIDDKDDKDLMEIVARHWKL